MLQLHPGLPQTKHGRQNHCHDSIAQHFGVLCHCVSHVHGLFLVLWRRGSVSPACGCVHGSWRSRVCRWHLFVLLPHYYDHKTQVHEYRLSHCGWSFALPDLSTLFYSYVLEYDVGMGECDDDRVERSILVVLVKMLQN